MDCCRYRDDGREGTRIPACAVRKLLSIPSRYAICIPSEMVSPAPIPADAWRTGDVRAVDFLRVQGRAHEGEERSPDHPRFRSARLDELPCSPAGAAWRSE